MCFDVVKDGVYINYLTLRTLNLLFALKHLLLLGLLQLLEVKHTSYLLAFVEAKGL